MMLLRWRKAVQLSGTPISVGSRDGPSVAMSSQSPNAWVPLQHPARDVEIPNLQTPDVYKVPPDDLTGWLRRRQNGFRDQQLNC